jgi:ATP-binding protein involved in chromosome partitioning
MAGREKIVTERKLPQPLKGIEKVKHFIAVGSGKGGVGKTTVAVNLAVALSKQGYKVGILDADVYGPSIPTMLDLHVEVEFEAGMMKPIEKFGLKIMSIGLMIDENQPVIWRGPMVTKAIRDFLGKVRWGHLDFLIVDLPPGTGDPSITISKSLPGASIVIVTTPQKVALADVKKAIHMFRKMGKEVAGVVENMSYFQCEHSTDKIEIFGNGGGEALTRELDIRFLGELPIDIELRKSGDEGEPFMIESGNSEIGKIFDKIAQGIAADVTTP